MAQIISDKPTNGVVVTDKPEGSSLVSNAPLAGKIDSQTEGYVYLENKTINKGEPMGMLLTLTYPNTFNFIGERI